MVCDLCHYDAHIQSRLPVTEELKELAMVAENDELSPYRNPFLKDMLEEERLRMLGDAEERKEELRLFVESRQSEISDEEGLDKVYENYLATLPVEERPTTRSHDRRIFDKWRRSRENEHAEWRKELEALESQRVDGQMVFDNVQDRLMHLLRVEARYAGLLPLSPSRRESVQEQDDDYSGPVSMDTEKWMTFAQVKEWAQDGQVSGMSTKPDLLRNPKAVERLVSRWSDILVETAEWLIQEGLLTGASCPVPAGQRAKRYLVHMEPTHSTNVRFKYPRQLSNGLYMECGFDVKAIVRQCEMLIERFGQDPAQFRVRLG